MKKQLFFLIIAELAIGLSLNAQVLSIAQVQGESDASPYLGQVVTIKGAVTGTYSAGYFMRDNETAWSGMYVYDQVNKPSLGDTVQVTAIVDEYYTWTELKTITSYTRISTGNPIPQPVELTTGVIDESWENCLVSVKNSKCTQTPATLKNGEWQINDGSGPAIVNDLGYSFIPQLDENYNVTGNVSFSFSFYKIEPRFAADVSSAAIIYFTTGIFPSSIEKDNITITWGTNIKGTTEVFYGTTPELGSGEISDTAMSETHSISIQGLSPGSFYYIKSQSVNGVDTVRSKPLLFSTASESTGEIRVCFNQAGIPVGGSDPPGIYTSSMIDTMIAYVNLAQSTLDVALYDFTNHASFSDTRNLGLVNAINAAHSRGVAVRLLTDAKVTNEVLSTLDPAIPFLKVKTTAIMHDKFIIVDRESTADSWLISGSTNPTYNNLLIDFNNLVAIQDQSVAKAYLLEFNEMFGSESGSPDTIKSLISSNKKDNTPHYFNVNGKRIEVYFSPSDFTTSNIVSALNTAETSIDFSMMAFTEDLLGNALVEAKAKNIKVRGVIDYVEYSGSEYPKLVNAGIKVADYANPGGAGWPDAPTLHHKFAVVDAGTPNAAVITGSHNWTAAADSKNDENTLIIHDTEISNLFKAESDRIYTWLKPMNCVDDTFESLDESSVSIAVISNDELPANFTMTVISQPKYGMATILPDFSIKYESIINCLCDIKDTLVYQVCYPNDPDYYLQATVFISMNFTKPIICSNDTIETVNQTLLNFTILENDFIPVEFNVSIVRQPEYGVATMEADKSITYQSTLCCNFKHITDTIVYKVCNQNGPLNCSLAFVYLTLDFTTSVRESELVGLQIWPNPVVSELNVDAENPVSQVEIFDLTGKRLTFLSPLKSEFKVPMPAAKGVYFIRIKTSSGETLMRKVIKL